MSNITKYTKEEIQSNLTTAFPELRDVSLTERGMALALCMKHNLNPLLKEIYLIKMGSKLAPVVNYLTLINKVRAKYPSIKEKWAYKEDGDWNLKACKLTLIINNEEILTQIVHLDEYNSGHMWKTKPNTMLQKVARAQAYRMIDSEFQDLYIMEEMKTDKSKATITEEVKAKVEATKLDELEIDEEIQEESNIPTPIDVKNIKEEDLEDMDEYYKSLGGNND